MTRWEHRTVVVTAGDDGPVNELCAEGWEPYAATAAESYGGPGSLTPIEIAVLLRRVAA